MTAKKPNEALLAEFVERMQNWQACADTEIAHYEADALLCELLERPGYKAVIDEYKQIGKWYA